MTTHDDAKKPVSLDSGRCGNWHVDTKPVAVLNDAASLHERIAYCWGMVNSFRTMVGLLMDHRDETMSELADVLWRESARLEVMLEQLGGETAKSERKKEAQHAQ